MIRTAVATFDDMIDDQPTTETSRWCAAVACRTAMAISLENLRPYSFPGLRAVVGIMCFRPLVRRRHPARRSECWWFERHACAAPWAFCILVSATVCRGRP